MSRRRDPGATVSSKREGAFGHRYAPSIDGVHDARARRGDACLERVPARRRRPPRCLLRAGDHRRSSPSRPPPARRRRPVDTGGGGDWAHVLQVVANLKAQPPAAPVVCLLGGSAARESTIDDASWAAQVEQLGGPSVVAYNLGSRNRTLAQDVELVRALRKTRGHRLHRHQRRPVHGPAVAPLSRPAASRRSRCRRTASTSTARARSSASPRRGRCSRQVAREALPRVQEELRHQPEDARAAHRRLQEPRPAPGAARAAARHGRSSGARWTHPWRASRPAAARWPGSAAYRG